MSDSHTARRVVLTGASSGIGRATALAFAREGADLVLAARGREALDTVAAECEAAGARTLVVPTDVADAGAMSELAQAALERFGGIDVWINNVGIGAVGRFEQTPIEAHRRVIEVNLIGHMNGAHAVLPHFRERRSGILINMISIGGWVSAPYAAAYTASKFGLRGFSESLRAELSDMRDVHVCEMYPTFVDTPGMSHGANHTGRRLRPSPPLVDAREVAAALVKLAKSPRASTGIGSVAPPARLAHAIAPNLLGRLSRQLFDLALARAQPAPITDGNLFSPSQGSAIDGGYRRPVPLGVSLAAVAALGALAWWATSRRGGR
ncbi:MAG: SDR family oxidoreductase [Methylibium sp.]|uniref:SDR family oxidoreductase n=1 Tax=Methylibium sp. TaxID=2067992 RepID=UPI00182DC519|nr:SDR family oxidoreductase [Methylibium sp.]MBA3599477.1 SDR family oxidoreductase [Methylibium sp.]